jgi:pyruvate kinase
LPSITEKDWEDLQFGIEQNADFFALSLVNDAETLHTVRDFLKKNNGHQELISKIESAKSIDNLEEIIQASDGIMVARGDLGAEMPLEDVPALQQQMITIADQHMKRVIVATQMLESMMENPIPSRAEVSDIAHAVEQGVDALMLSGETAIGKYPVETIAMMSSIAERYAYNSHHESFDLEPRQALALAAVAMADSIEADALVVFSRSGRSANSIAHHDPHTPIHAFTFTEEVMRKMVLMRSVTPHSIEASDNYQTTIDAAIEHLLEYKHIQKPYRVVVTSSLLGTNENDMTIQIREGS